MITDLHCHLLPGIDDGPPTMEETLDLARALVADGVQRVVATPHVNHRWPTSAATIAAGVAEVREAVAAAGIPLDVQPGAEVAAEHLLSLPASELPGLSLGGAGWILLEAPMSRDFPIEGAVARVQELGHGVVLAHPERCRLFQRGPLRVRELVQGGALVSLTSSALVGRFGRAALALAQACIETDLVHNVASDAHAATWRAPTLGADLREAGLADRQAQWCAETPARLLDAGGLSVSGP
jgi:protein-tyrosine phosphatase